MEVVVAFKKNNRVSLAHTGLVHADSRMFLIHLLAVGSSFFGGWVPHVMDMSVCPPISSPFFFFKQKTAYEIRPRDWSSDVCSSDLAQQAEQAAQVESPEPRSAPG